MQASKPRLYLFHGSDSRASLQALSKWTALFRQKYGETTAYVFEADEVTSEQLGSSLANALQGDTLFSLPKLITIKRPSQLDKGSSSRGNQALVALIQDSIGLLGEDVTVLLWDDRRLEAPSPVVRMFEELCQKNQAEVRLFQLPVGGSLARLVQTYLAGEASIEPEALRYLERQYRLVEAEARLLQRLKSDQSLRQDPRGWWLYNLLDTALLLCENGSISLKDIQNSAEEIGDSVNSFSVAQAFCASKWLQARMLLGQLESNNSDDSTYFGILAAMKWQLERRSNLSPRLQAGLTQLLFEIELIAKNYPVPIAWLLSLTLDRIQELAEGGQLRSLVPAKRLWLANISRS